MSGSAFGACFLLAPFDPAADEAFFSLPTRVLVSSLSRFICADEELATCAVARATEPPAAAAADVVAFAAAAVASRSFPTVAFAAAPTWVVAFAIAAPTPRTILAAAPGPLGSCGGSGATGGGGASAGAGRRTFFSGTHIEPPLDEVVPLGHFSQLWRPSAGAMVPTRHRRHSDP